jgi:hypothetical protein
MAGLEYSDSSPKPAAVANGNHPPFARGGHWREAVNNIEDDLDIYVEKRASSR